MRKAVALLRVAAACLLVAEPAATGSTDASEVAVIAGGDDVTFNATMAPALMASAGEGMRYFVRHLAEDLPAARRAGSPVRRSPGHSVASVGTGGSRWDSSSHGGAP